MSEKRAKASGKPTFENELLRLEEVVNALESGDVPLAELVTRYEDGMRHLKSCRDFLADAELRLEQLRSTPAGDTLASFEAPKPEERP